MALALAAALALAPMGLSAEAGCPAGAQPYRITGYLRWSPPMNPTTADGTPIWTPEPIAAASTELELGAYVYVQDLGTYRVADRLGDPGHVRRLDIAVWTLEEAYALTSERCVWELP